MGKDGGYATGVGCVGGLGLECEDFLDNVAEGNGVALFGVGVGFRGRVNGRCVISVVRITAAGLWIAALCALCIRWVLGVVGIGVILVVGVLRVVGVLVSVPHASCTPVVIISDGCGRTL